MFIRCIVTCVFILFSLNKKKLEEQNQMFCPSILSSLGDTVKNRGVLELDVEIVWPLTPESRVEIQPH